MHVVETNPIKIASAIQDINSLLKAAILEQWDSLKVDVVNMNVHVLRDLKKKSWLLCDP